MKKLILSVALLFVAVGFTQAKPNQSIGKQDPAKEERSVADFTGISSGGNFDVFISLGTTESLRLEGDAESLKEIETVVDKGTLKIQYKGKKNYWNWDSSDRKKVSIYITAKVLTNLSVSGSGNMKVEGLLQSPDFRANVSGSGNMKLNAESVNFRGVISGSGTITLSGNAQNTQITISGSGGMRAKEFKTKTADVTVSGSGSASLFVEKSLKGTISGSGSIRYDGNPDVTEVKSGSGSISKIQ